MYAVCVSVSLYELNPYQPSHILYRYIKQHIVNLAKQKLFLTSL